MTEKNKIHKKNCIAILVVDPFSIPFQGVKTYVASTDRIKSNNKLDKSINKITHFFKYFQLKIFSNSLDKKLVTFFEPFGFKCS